MLKDQEHIDIYLKGQLNADDLKAFEQAMSDDPAFANEVLVQKQIVEAIKSVRHDELKAYLKEELSKETVVTPMFNIRWFTAVAASLILVAAWYFLLRDKMPGAEQPIVQKTETIEPSDSQPVPSALSVKEQTPTIAVPPPPEPFDIASTEIEQDNPPPVVTDDQNYLNEENGNPEIEEVPENVVVKQDQLWASRYIPVTKVELINRQAVSDSEVKKAPQAKKVEEKDSEVSDQDKKTEAEIAKPSEPEVTFKVEFWKSIVNFKGYSFDGLTIKLYGIDNNSRQISLYSIQGKLYMRWNNEYYYLPVSREYVSYQKVTDKSVLGLLPPL